MSDKIRSILVDDEAGNRANLKSLLENYCPQIEVIGEANSAVSAMDLIHQTKPQLVFLDIEMPQGNGFDLLNKLDRIDFEVIFVTAFDQYALKAIKFCALDYILKPIDILDLKAAVQKAENRILEHEHSEAWQVFQENQKSQSNPKIALPTGNQVDYVPIAEIIRCRGEGNYTHFYLTSGKALMVSKTLKEFEELLKEHRFLRVHQSHLINVRFVKSYVKSDGGFLRMEDQSEIPISRQRKEFVLAKLK
ncbi:MAG: LytTR family DNA-binding domain-containing protein [Bacteroidota bacterium]